MTVQTEGRQSRHKTHFLPFFRNVIEGEGFFSQEMRGEFATFKDKLSSVWIIMTKTLLVWPTTRLEWFLMPKKMEGFLLKKKKLFILLLLCFHYISFMKNFMIFFRCSRYLKKDVCTYFSTQKTVRGLWIKIFWVLTYRTQMYNWKKPSHA